jgi:hypothetical protein
MKTVQNVKEVRELISNGKLVSEIAEAIYSDNCDDNCL